jgi:hypothetical protein
MKSPILRHYGGWIALIIAAAAYFHKFSHSPVGTVLYVQRAECLLDGQPLLQCAPEFSYPPALAFMMIPLVPLSMGLRTLLWYLVSIAAAVACVGLSEALAIRLYPAVRLHDRLYWLRGISLLLGLKFILAVYEYQAFDTLAFCFIMIGLWALVSDRARLAGGMLATAAAIKATPLIFLPYLLLKRRFLAASVFLIVFLLACFLPDLIGVLKGTRTGYFAAWVSEVAGPALAPDGVATPYTQVFWVGWMGSLPNNQSLRGVLHRALTGPVFGLEPEQIILICSAMFVAAVAVLLLVSARRDELVGVDGSLLLISMLMLSPMTSRYHFVLLVLPYTVLVAACLADDRMRVLGGTVLFASFMLLTGTSNEVVGTAVSEFAYSYGFFVMGTLLLLVPLGAVVWYFRSPGPDVKRAACAARFGPHELEFPFDSFD